MKHTKLALALAAAGMLAASGQVVAFDDQPFHVTGALGSYYTDGDRNLRTDDIWYSVGFGYFFNDNISVDLEYDSFTGTWKDYQDFVPGATYDKWSLKNIGLMGRYYMTDWKVRPFLAVGIGELTHGNVSSEEGSMSMSFGGGIAGKFTKHLSGRLQVIYRKDRDNNTYPDQSSFGDTIVSFGLSYDFGGSEPPPPEPEPAPAPPPPPPPPPNPDLDGDGVLNEHDKCPNTRPGAVVDLDGCEVEVVIELKGVHFDFDSSTLKPEAEAILDKAADLLAKHERVVVEVGGHTDSTGPESYNQGLSERRANAVQDYLVNKGVRASRLSAKGYGETMPVASNDTREGRAMNRRVELVVLDR